MRQLAKAAAIIAILTTCATAQSPASRPAAPAAEAYPALQKKLQELRAEVDRLTTENADLRAKLDAADARIAAWIKAPVAGAAGAGAGANAGAPPDTAGAMRLAVVDRLKMGMTTDEVVAILGKPRERSRDGANVVYEYKATDPGVQAGATYYPGQSYEARCYFDADGKLADIRDSDATAAPVNTGKAPAQDGRQPR